MKNGTQKVTVQYQVLIPFRSISGNNFVHYHSGISQLLLPPKKKNYKYT